MRCASERTGTLWSATRDYSRLPCFLEFDRIDRGEDIDPQWRDADLIDNAGGAQILLGEILQGCAEFHQGAEDLLCVGGDRTHPDIEVARRPYPAVRS